jgi:hypothetical protein
VAQVQTAGPDHRDLQVPELDQRRYQQLDAARVDRPWRDVRSAEATISRRVESVLADVRREHEAEIEQVSAGAPDERTRRWQLLDREYEVALDDLRQTDRRPLIRPTDVEHAALGWLGRQRAAQRLHRAHRAYLHTHAVNERRRLLEALLEELRRNVGERLAFMRQLAQRANADRQAPDLRLRGAGSAAWRGQLDRPHPFQVHVLDLVALGRTDRRSPAVERLYRWATEAIMGLAEEGGPNYGRFLPEIAGLIDVERPDQDAEQLSRAVVGFLEARYLRHLRSATLFELLAQAAPAERGRGGAQETVDRALTELMHWLQTRMTSLVTFDERIGGEQGSEALRTAAACAPAWSRSRARSSSGPAPRAWALRWPRCGGGRWSGRASSARTWTRSGGGRPRPFASSSSPSARWRRSAACRRASPCGRWGSAASSSSTWCRGRSGGWWIRSRERRWRREACRRRRVAQREWRQLKSGHARRHTIPVCSWLLPLPPRQPPSRPRWWCWRRSWQRLLLAWPA